MRVVCKFVSVLRARAIKRAKRILASVGLYLPGNISKQVKYDRKIMRAEIPDNINFCFRRSKVYPC